MAPGTNRSMASRYRHGIRTSIRNNASAYGYSIVATGDFAVLHALQGPPRPAHVFLFVLGAVVSFAAIEAIASDWFRIRMRGDPAEVVMLGSAFNLFSISGAIGAAYLMGLVPWRWLAWSGGAAVSTAVYLLVLGVEMALAARAAHAREREEKEED